MNQSYPTSNASNYVEITYKGMIRLGYKINQKGSKLILRVVMLVYFHTVFGIFSPQYLLSLNSNIKLRIECH